MKRKLLLATAGMMALSAGTARAQETTPVDPAADGTTARASDADAGDENIIVTAQRRAQELSDVPIAITAVNAETLQNSGSTDIRGLSQIAPSLQVNAGTSDATAAARIRGIGTVGENAGLEADVALFVDGVYRSRTGAGVSELGEIDRIEVLRGPQGTLSGRNSTAGAINIYSRRPQFDFEARAAATYGNYDYVRLEGSATGPIISDSLAASINAVWERRDGFVEQLTAGEPDINDRDRWVVRGQLLYEPNDQLSVRLIGDYATRDENCCAALVYNPVRGLSRNAQGQVVSGPNPLVPILTAIGANFQFAPQGEKFIRTTATTPGVPYTNEGEDWGFSGQVDWDLGFANLTSITAYRHYFFRFGGDVDYNAADILRITNRNREFDVFSQELRLQGQAFNDRLDWLVGAYYADERLRTDDDVSYGADYELWANCLAVAAQPPIAATLNPTRATCSTSPAWPGFQGIAAALGAARLSGTGAVSNLFVQDSTNYALFTHNVFQVIPGLLDLTLGARYTHETKTIESSLNMSNTLCSAINASPFQALAALPCLVNQTAPDFSRGDPGTRISDDEWTGTAVLTLRPADGWMAYASYSRGFKAGGFNLDPNAIDRPCSTTAGSAAQNAACVALRALPAFTPLNGRPEATDLQFDSETVDAYELGVKWNGPGIDINAAVFYQSFSNFQINVFNGINFEVSNLQSCRDDLGGTDRDTSATTGACAADRLRPGVVSKGFELEWALRPARHLQVNGGFTWLNSRFRENLTGTNGRPLTPALFQLPGSRTQFSSEFAVTSSVAWTPPIGSNLSGLVYFDMRYQSDSNTGGDLDLEKLQDGFAVVNGRLGVETNDERWGVELWAMNLFDTDYQTTASDAPTQGSGTFRGVQSGNQASASQIFLAFPGAPRTYGVTVRTRF